MDILIKKILDETALKQKRSIVLFLWAFMMLEGYISNAPDVNSSIKEIVTSLILPCYAAVAFAWCSIEEHVKGKVLGFWWGVGNLILTPIVYPAYVFSNKGLKQGAFIIIKSIAVLFVATIISMITSDITANLATT